jgi:ATP-dependent helicase/nuclease subunit A
MNYPKYLSNEQHVPFSANGNAISEEAFQQLALNIEQNVVIEACAGSGKTWLLVARLLKLLLKGIDPKHIVAITFTRKAAQEMKTRLADMLDTLQATVQLSNINNLTTNNSTNNATNNADIIKEGTILLSILNYPLNDTNSQLIQTIWERCSQQGNWPAIVTFHEWFGELRNNAPLSSLASAGAVLNDDIKVLKQQAWQQFWNDTQHNTSLKNSMQLSITTLGLRHFETALESMLERRAEWWVYAETLDSIPPNKQTDENTQSQENSIYSVANAPFLAKAAHEKFITALNLPNLFELQQVFNELVPKIKDIIAIYSSSKSPTLTRRTQALINALDKATQLTNDFQGDLSEKITNTVCNQSSQSSQSPQLFTLLKKIVRTFLKALSTDKGVMSKIYFTDLDKVVKNHPKYGDSALFVSDVEDLYARLTKTNDYLLIIESLPTHAHLLHCGAHWLASYQILKQTQGIIDFTDLELDALNLLRVQNSNTPVASILQLGLTVQHLLLDEFQDTNPVQWQALQAFLMPLLEETQAGGQASSVFIVGDPKQSIYQFRRADPRLFTHVKTILNQRFNAVLLKTQRTRRNAQHINDWINTVFVEHSTDSNRLNQEDDPPLFSTQFTLSPSIGIINLLPVLSKPKKDSTTKNSNKLDELDTLDTLSIDKLNILNTLDTLDISNTETINCQSPAALEAQQVLNTLKHWKARNPNLPWSQAMVLSRKREPLIIIAQLLRQAGIDYISADKGGFFNLPEITDVMAILNALANPRDELSVLNALRSPIFALTDTQLSELLEWRSTLPSLLNQASTEDWLGLGQLNTPWAIHTLQWLTSWQLLCNRLPMHDALDVLLHQGQWLERLSVAYPERASSIHGHLAQLLQIALNVDQGRYPSLGRFIQAINELKLVDTTAAQSVLHTNAVRLSTIHGAKGLEADCVCIIDLYSADSHSNQSINILLDWLPEQKHPNLFALQLLQDAVLSHCPNLAELIYQQNQAQKTERDTVLYVAMTRAVNELWCSAHYKKNVRSVYERLGKAYTHIQAQLNSTELMDTDTPAIPTIHATKIDNYSLIPLSEHIAPTVLLPATKLYDEAVHHQALGTLMHHFFEHTLRYETLPNTNSVYQWAIALNIELNAAEHLSKQCIEMVHNTQLLQLCSPSITHLAIEESIYLTENKDVVLRPDIVAYFYQPATILGQPNCALNAWIIDFKLHFDASDNETVAQEYATQLLQYSQALYLANVRYIQCYLLTLSGECWQLLDNNSSNNSKQWQKVTFPWSQQPI